MRKPSQYITIVLVFFHLFPPRKAGGLELNGDEYACYFPIRDEQMSSIMYPPERIYDDPVNVLVMRVYYLALAMLFIAGVSCPVDGGR